MNYKSVAPEMPYAPEEPCEVCPFLLKNCMVAYKDRRKYCPVFILTKKLWKKEGYE